MYLFYPRGALVLQAGNPPGERWAQRAGAAVPGDGTGTAGLSQSAHRIFSRFCSLLPPPRQNRNPTFAWFPWHVILADSLITDMQDSQRWQDMSTLSCPLGIYCFLIAPKLLTIYSPMISTALCVMPLMRAASITRASGMGLGPGNREFFGPCEMASSR